MDQTILASGKIATDRSLRSKLRRRMNFVQRYMLARVYWQKMERIVPLVAKSFEHPWVAGAELRLQFWPGKERGSANSMHWDAPIGITIFRRRKGKKRQAICMSLYVSSRNIYIAQLQGFFGTDVPAELRHWPKLFIETCRSFARQEGFRAVMVPKAETLYSYRNPFIHPDLLPEARERTLERIRKNMKLLYDTNALDLGFVSDGGWLKWEN